jgi:hypothetical protein
MINVLVCTIARNLEKNFDVYYSQLRSSVTKLSSEYNFFFSFYENDSMDTTKNLVNNADWSFFKEYSIITEDLNLGIFTGGDLERVRILANSRNKCLEARDMYKNMDWIVFVESDIEYTPEIFEKILQHNNQDVDIFSGIAVTKETKIIYDLWATRYSQNDKPDEEATVVNLEYTGVKELWATFSCICLYKAEPFKKGVRFHWINDRFETRDCDTTVICENFRKAGYTKIFADYSINPEHPSENLIVYAIHPGENAAKLKNFIRNFVRNTDEVVITDNPKALKLREYIFELYADEVPSGNLLHCMRCVKNPILETKPNAVSIPIMNVELGLPNQNMAENGATSWPNYQVRLYRRDVKSDSDNVSLTPIGALAIWNVKNHVV